MKMNGVRHEWHLLKLFRVPMESDVSPGQRTGFHQERIGLGSSFDVADIGGRGDHRVGQVESLLSKASPDTAFRAALDAEAQALTNIGNSFHIRHSEVSQTAVTDSAHVDYLFHRLYCMIQLLVSQRRAVS